MNLTFVRSSFALSLLALAAASPVPITVQVDGQTYVGSVTRAAVGAGLEVPPEQALVGGPAPLAVHLDAMDVLDPAALRDVRVTWDFGDPNGARNVLDGYNAAHAYDAPGTYTITRTTVAPAGRSERTYRVTVTPDARRLIHVSADGNDAADGATPAAAIRTWGRAAAILRGARNATLLLRRGDRFPVAGTLDIKGDDVRIASYGDVAAAGPVLALSVPQNNFAMIVARGARAVVEHVTFDSDVVGDGLDKKNVVDSINAGGRGLLVRGCTFRAVGCAVNGNGQPDGVLLADNDAPLETGVRAYLAWMQGVNWTLLDNRAANSTREHIARAGGAERLNITGNRFANVDRRDAGRGGDAGDFSKTTLNIQKGRVAWVAQNVLRDGPVSCGPLGGADGKNEPEARWIGATFENNRIVNGELMVQHGARHVTFRNNLIERSDDPTFAIFDFNAEYGRGCVDVTIDHNTSVNGGTRGNFVRVGAGAVGVRLIRNAYVAPNLVTGPYAAGPVYVQDATTDAIASAEGNRWGEPARALGDAAKAGPFILGGRYASLARWQQAAASDRIVAIAPGTLRVDDAGVDVTRLPPP